MKYILFFFIFVFTHFIVYNYIKNKYKQKTNINVEYIIPPVTYEDYFIFKDLDKFYGGLFNRNVEELNLVNKSY